MSFGPTTIQPPATLNFRNKYIVEDTSASDIRNGDIADMNREARIARQEREAEYNE